MRIEGKTSVRTILLRVGRRREAGRRLRGTKENFNLQETSGEEFQLSPVKKHRVDFFFTFFLALDVICHVTQSLSRRFHPAHTRVSVEAASDGQ